MKRLICLIALTVVLFCNVLSISAEVLGSGTNNPVTRDEVEIGTIVGFDEEDGNFGTNVYYLKVQDNRGREVTYPLADKVYLNYTLYSAKDVVEILKAGSAEIAYVIRSEKIKYINPHILHYNGEKNIRISKGYSEEVTVKIFGANAGTEVVWSSDSKIIFEFLEITGEHGETVKIKGRIVGEATLTANLYVNNEIEDSVNIMVDVTGSMISVGTNKPLSPDEIQKGTITGFIEEDGNFGATVNYVKILHENGEENTYPLAKTVILEETPYTSDDTFWILQNLDRDITFAIRSGKIEYINPYMPEEIFESMEIEDCYRWKGKIYGYLSFEYLVGECTCVVAAYNDEDILCSVISFDVSYKDAYSYDFELDDNGGTYIKVLFIESKQSLKPMAEGVTAIVE